MEGVDALAEGDLVGGAEVGEAVVVTEVLGGVVVASIDEGVGSGTGGEAGEPTEDATTLVIDEEDAEIGGGVVPEGVAVVEEGEVTGDAIDEAVLIFLGSEGSTYGCAYASFDAVEAAVAAAVVGGVAVGEAHDGAVGIIDGRLAVGELLLKEFDGQSG